MPNFCYCELEISGDKKDIKRIKRLFKDQIFSLHKIVPYPKEYQILDEYCQTKHKKRFEKKYAKILAKLQEKGFKLDQNGYSQGGYEWCLKNWGTKSETFVSNLIIDEDFNLIYSFYTAWNPPVEAIRRLSEKFPKLWFQLRYFEKGNGLCGIINLQNGKIIEKASLDYHGYYGG